MRENEFRAWDSFAKKMHYDVGVMHGKCVPLYGETWVVEQTKPYPNYANIDEAFHKIEHGLILMQFICLLDKQGKKIYEGDIVRQCFNDEPWEGIITISPTQGALVSGKPIWVHNVEVIGNIYQDSHLLESGAKP